MLIIADASPLHYLVLVGHVEILPALYERIMVPERVMAELRHQQTPIVVREWIETRPEWLEVRQVHVAASGSLAELGDGERDAILLALELHADLILLDDRRARVEASRQSLSFTGTLGVLEAASRRDLVNLPEVVGCLLETNFRVAPSLIHALLTREARRRGYT